jgi:NAD-dependent deacetylase
MTWQRPPQRPSIDEHTRVLVMTGAGISAESGLATFRGAGGLWDGQPVERVATPEGFAADPALVWRFYSERRAQAAAALPNRAHHALAKLEVRLGDRFLLATQNVDGLHQRAGSHRVVEMHGSLWRTRCAVCPAAPVEDRGLVEPPLPRCTRCGGLLRPAIVWFGELLDAADTRRIERFIVSSARGASRLVFLAVGTSGNVWPAAGYVGLARSAGADTWLVNLDPAENVGAFDHFVQGPAGEVLAPLLGVDDAARGDDSPDSPPRECAEVTPGEGRASYP